MHLAYCGFDCGLCPVYIVTETGDAELRESVLRKYAETDYPLTPDDLRCAGCRSDSASINRMCAGCDIRNCARANGADNCAVCGSYPCGVIERSLPEGSGGRERLDAMRRELDGREEP